MNYALIRTGYGRMAHSQLMGHVINVSSLSPQILHYNQGKLAKFKIIEGPGQNQVEYSSRQTKPAWRKLDLLKVVLESNYTNLQASQPTCTHNPTSAPIPFLISLRHNQLTL